MEDDVKKAYLYSIKLLTKRDYSSAKLRNKLVEKKYCVTAIDQVIKELLERRFVRDELFAEARIKALMHKGYSPSFICKILLQEALPMSLESIHAIFSEYNLTTEEQIAQLINKKMPKKVIYQADQQLITKHKNRVLRYLVSKGHELSKSERMLSTYIEKESQF